MTRATVTSISPGDAARLRIVIAASNFVRYTTERYGIVENDPRLSRQYTELVKAINDYERQLNLPLAERSAVLRRDMP